MIQELIKIKYSYYYVNFNRDFEDVLYMCKDLTINYNNRESVGVIVNEFLMESDRKRVFRNIVNVENLGKRFFG